MQEKNNIPQGQTLEFSTATNLLEQSAYKYQLQDEKHRISTATCSTTNRCRRSLSITATCRSICPEKIWITDTTFRDGQQSTSPFTVGQIVDLFRLLHKLGGPKGLVRQSEFFIYSEKDRRAVEECMSLGYEFPEVTSWIRANEKDFELVKSLGLKETGVLVSCSDYHIYNKMGLTRAKAMDKYLGIVKSVLDRGIRPRCHFEDITRADYYGFVVPFAEALAQLSEESGIPIKIRACDTMGFGVTYQGAALPRSVPGIVYGLQHYAGFPAQCLNGTVTMTSTRSLPTHRPHGSTAVPASTAPFSASAKEPETARLRQWLSNTHPSAAPPTGWIFRSSPR